MSECLSDSSGCVSVSVSLRLRAQGCQLWELRSPGQLCVCDDLHPQPEMGYGLEGLYIQVPATGDTGM